MISHDLPAQKCSAYTPIRRRQVTSLCLVILILISTSSLVNAQEGVIGPAVPPVTDTPAMAATTGATSTDCEGVLVPASNVEYEAAVVVLINDIRVQNGLLPLKHVDALDNSGRYHAHDMAVDGYFAHDSRSIVNNQLVESCTWSNRIQAYYTGWGRLAENIAAGYRTPEAAVQGWMQSEGHKANILNADLWETGVGYFGGAGPYGHYWVQDFGRRSGQYPLILDNDALTTDTGTVTVHLYGDWQEVRLRTDQDAWSEWQPFQQVTSWSITGGAGEHTVSAEMRKGNEVVSSSDTIILTQSKAPPVNLSQLPDTLSFTYYSQGHVFAPSVHVLRPLDQPAIGYHWRVDVDGNWLNVSPMESNGADPMEMRALVSTAESDQSTTAILTFSLLNSNNEVVDTHTTSVQLAVANGTLTDIYLPTVIR